MGKPDLPEVDPKLEPELDDLNVEAGQLWDQGEFDQAHKVATQAWELLPEPRLEWDFYSQVIPRQAAEAAAENGDAEHARHWLGLAREAYDPPSDAAKELLDFIEGLIAYRSDDPDGAYKLWSSLDKSVFNGRPDEYWEFVQERKTGKKPSKRMSVKAAAKMDDELRARLEELNEKAEAADDAGDPDGAIAAWEEAYGLLPEPKTEHGEALQILGSLGDVLFQQGRFDDALGYLEDAIEVPGGRENPFVWLRLGECQFELGNKDASADALTSALMLEGEGIFAAEDPKYRKSLEGVLKPEAKDEKKSKKR